MRSLSLQYTKRILDTFVYLIGKVVDRSNIKKTSVNMIILAIIRLITVHMFKVRCSLKCISSNSQNVVIVNYMFTIDDANKLDSACLSIKVGMDRNGDSDTQKNTNVYTITKYNFIR